MDKLLYVSMSGASENMRAQQMHSNNLANATTTGFRSDFEAARSMRVLGDGFESRVYAQTERPGTNFESGALQETGNPLDIAVDGQGWIAVQSPDGGEAYTRNGNLMINANGLLVTPSGLPVLGTTGAPIEIPQAAQVDIANDGTINAIAQGDSAADMAQLDQIKLVNPDPASLFKGQDGLIHSDEPGPALPDQDVTIRSGYLESSNVNAVAELTKIISLSRQFEMQVSMMSRVEDNSSAATNILQLS